MEIPERHEDVTPEWLTDALRSSGVLGEHQVTDCRVEPLGANVSRTSSVAKIELEYEPPDEHLPSSLFAKFVSRIPGNRQLADELGLFEREIELHRTFGDSIPLTMPRMHFGASTPGSDTAVLLLESFDGVSKVPSPTNHLSATEATLALRDLARMHAKWWQDPVLRQHEWLQTVGSGLTSWARQGYASAWERLKAILKPGLTDEEFGLCDRLPEYVPTLRSVIPHLLWVVSRDNTLSELGDGGARLTTASLDAPR